MVYHVFNIELAGIRYRLNGIYDDPGFERIMGEAFDWKLPYGLSVYHFETDKDPEIALFSNSVMKSREIIDLSVSELFRAKFDQAFVSSSGSMDKSSLVSLSLEHDIGLIARECGYNKIVPIRKGTHQITADLQITPIDFKSAKQFVSQYHRHNSAPQGHKFSIAVESGGVRIGVAMASIPRAIHQNDWETLEVIRCCVDERFRNACSKAYSAVIRVAKGMGYKRLLTYTLVDEPGSSLLAVGFKKDGIVESRGYGWNSPSRPRKKPERYPEGDKIRWVLTL